MSPLGPAPQYLAKYNGYILPGYVQNESFDSIMNIADHYGAYIDGSLSEETGLSNKSLTLSLRIWDCDYLTAKKQVELAATMLRSWRLGFAPLYVQFTDRHYMALVKSIKMQKQAGTSVRILDYDIEFECKPWAISDTQRTISGTGSTDTDQVSRTIDNGGWTPTIVNVSGSDVRIIGNTATQQTGVLTITGSVTNLIVDTELFTATMGGLNANSYIANTDYRLYVGPEKTTFTITGASSCDIQYFDRWYI
jgi:hypothetical protein